MILFGTIKTMSKALVLEDTARERLRSWRSDHRGPPPRAVVGIIAPWRYPAANALMDAIGALAAVVRSAEAVQRTPLTAAGAAARHGWTGSPQATAPAQCARGSEAVIDNSTPSSSPAHVRTAPGDWKVRPQAEPVSPAWWKDSMIVLEDDEIEILPHTPWCWGATFNAGRDARVGRAGRRAEPVNEQFVDAPDVGSRRWRWPGRRLRRDDRRQPGRRHRTTCARRGGRSARTRSTGGERTAGAGQLTADGRRRRTQTTSMACMTEGRPSARRRRS